MSDATDDLDGATPVQKVYDAIRRNDPARLRRYLSEHPDLLNYTDAATPTWLHVAATAGSLEAMRALLDLGLRDKLSLEVRGVTVLERAVSFKQMGVARFLLDEGAEPGVSRPLLAAVNIEPESDALPFIELLIDYGADVNQSFAWFGDESVRVTALSLALDRGKRLVADFLRSRGAVEPKKKRKR